MTDKQKIQIKMSFASLEKGNSDFGQKLYHNLFRKSPELIHLFKGDITNQAGKFTLLLKMVVENIDNLKNILHKVNDLGRRHRSYGVRPEHYILVGEVLLTTLEEELEENEFVEARDAWSDFYKAVSLAMQQ